jgi:hypothetical protein
MSPLPRVMAAIENVESLSLEQGYQDFLSSNRSANLRYQNIGVFTIDY